MMGQQRMANGMVPSQMSGGMQQHMNGPVKLEQQQQQQYQQHQHPHMMPQPANRVSSPTYCILTQNLPQVYATAVGRLSHGQ